MGFIYLIENNINKDKYIGKTKYTIEKRFKKHCEKSKYGSETHLHRAIRIYGKDNFSLKQLELVFDNDQLNEKEKIWIEQIKPAYNMTIGGDGGLTFAITEEYRKACSEKYSGSGNPMYGKIGKLNPKFGKKYGPKPLISKAKNNPCVCDSIKFESIGIAEQYFKSKNIAVCVRKRLDSKHHPNWYRLVPKRLYG